MAETPDCIIISDEEHDELNLHANSETVLRKKKPTPEEVIPDSEEDEPIRSLLINPPHTPLRQSKQHQQQSDEYECPSSPLSPLPILEKKKKRKLLKDITLPIQTVRKKAKPSKEPTVPPQRGTGSPVLSAEKPTSLSETPTHTIKLRAKPKPKPKAKPKKHKEDSDISQDVQETPLTTSLQPQIDRESPKPPKAQKPRPSRETQRPDRESNVEIETFETLKPKSNGKEQHYQTKENPPPPPQPVSKHTDDNSSLAYTFPSKKNNRPITDILRNLNQSSPYTRRFSPAVSRNFLTRIAPLHPNRREPPPPPPRIIPKKTKKEIEREERWEEELQDSIPNWCQLTEEERQRFRKEKRDWELGLYEE